MLPAFMAMTAVHRTNLGKQGSVHAHIVSTFELELP